MPDRIWIEPHQTPKDVRVGFLFRMSVGEMDVGRPAMVAAREVDNLSLADIEGKVTVVDAVFALIHHQPEV